MHPSARQQIGEVALADGTVVAYATSGEGPPLLHVPGWVSHLELGWALVPERRFYEALGHGRTLIRYDRPGSGLSGPAPSGDLVATEHEVIAAVLGALGVRRCDVLGASLAAPLAVSWAAAHPESVDRLVLFGGWSDGAAIAAPEVREQLLGLVAQHWGLGSELLTDVFAPDADAAFRAAFVAHQRHSTDAVNAARCLAACYAIDVTADLARVGAPTHVVHREGDRAAPLAEALRLAEGIAGATTTVLPGRAHIPFAGDTEAVVDAIRDALGLPRWRAPQGRLTPRQLEVASLVAQGLTNRAIAERLVITERSAESHVERIRDRLGFRSRSQVAAWYATAHPELR